MTDKKLSFDRKVLLAFLASLIVGVPSIVVATESTPAPSAVADVSRSGAS